MHILALLHCCIMRISCKDSVDAVTQLAIATYRGLSYR